MEFNNPIFKHFDSLDTFRNSKVSGDAQDTTYITTDGYMVYETPEVVWDDVCFIDDTKQIWSHGLFYGVNSEYIVFILALTNTCDRTISLSVNDKIINVEAGQAATMIINTLKSSVYSGDCVKSENKLITIGINKTIHDNDTIIYLSGYSYADNPNGNTYDTIGQTLTYDFNYTKYCYAKSVFCLNLTAFIEGADNSCLKPEDLEDINTHIDEVENCFNKFLGNHFDKKHNIEDLSEFSTYRGKQVISSLKTTFKTLLCLEDNICPKKISLYGTSGLREYGERYLQLYRINEDNELYLAYKSKNKINIYEVEDETKYNSFIMEYVSGSKYINSDETIFIGFSIWTNKENEFYQTPVICDYNKSGAIESQVINVKENIIGYPTINKLPILHIEYDYLVETTIDNYPTYSVTNNIVNSKIDNIFVNNGIYKNWQVNEELINSGDTTQKSNVFSTTIDENKWYCLFNVNNPNYLSVSQWNYLYGAQEFLGQRYNSPRLTFLWKFVKTNGGYYIKNYNGKYLPNLLSSSSMQPVDSLSNAGIYVINDINETDKGYISMINNDLSAASWTDKEGNLYRFIGNSSIPTTISGTQSVWNIFEVGSEIEDIREITRADYKYWQAQSVLSGNSNKLYFISDGSGIIHNGVVYKNTPYWIEVVSEEPTKQEQDVIYMITE